MYPEFNVPIPCHFNHPRTGYSPSGEQVFKEKQLKPSFLFSLLAGGNLFEKRFQVMEQTFE